MQVYSVNFLFRWVSWGLVRSCVPSSFFPALEPEELRQTSKGRRKGLARGEYLFLWISLMRDEVSAFLPHLKGAQLSSFMEPFSVTFSGASWFPKSVTKLYFSICLGALQGAPWDLDIPSWCSGSSSNLGEYNMVLETGVPEQAPLAPTLSTVCTQIMTL